MKTSCVFCFILTLMAFTIKSHAQEEFCCERRVMFAPVEMPAEQEYNSTGFLECAFYEGVNIWGNRYECPIELSVKDADARMSLEQMISKLSDLAGSPPNPDYEKAIDNYQDLDYVFFAELKLDELSEIHEGSWEEDSDGQPYYQKGNAWGNYSIDIRLMNVYFNEKVWAGHTIWWGNALGYTEWPPDKTTPNAVEDLGATMSPKIDKLIYDYERTPMNCTIAMEQEEVSAGEEIEINLTNITDEKGRQSRHWQRLVISLDQGEITNATKYGREEKHWVVLVGEEGQVTLKYKAPRLCQKEKETIKIFNSCVWGGPTKPLEDTEPKKQLTFKTFDIVPSEPKDCNVNIDYKTEYPPYFKLDITNIINEKDKPFPDNLLIAVKSEKGRLEGGTFASGWRIYSTTGGRITEKIKYTPPQCAISNTDLLSFAAVCETKNGSLTISPVKFTKKITNPLCSDATFTLTTRHLNERTLDKEETLGNDHWDRTSDYRYDRKGTITIQLKKHSVLDLPSIGNRTALPETWVYYISKSRSFDSWDITYFEHRYEESTSKSGGYRQKISEEAQISDVRLKLPDVPMMIIVAYDKNTKKAKRVMVQASFEMGYTMNILRSTETESWLGGEKKSSSNSESKTKNETYFFQITGNPVMDPALGKEFPSGCLVSGGDGKTSFSGSGKIEETKPITNDRYYEEIHDLKTSEWVLTVNEK